MSDKLMDDLIEFLKSANLSTYEINSFLTLVRSSQFDGLSAREITDKSNVPTGRIYEVLEDLSRKKMIEIIESRPKKYRSISLNKALDNLLEFQKIENERNTSYLYQQVKLIEKKIYDSDIFIKKEPSKLFWSTAFGYQSILSLYRKACEECKEEILLNDFINKNTIKILPFAKKLYEPFKNAADNGVKLKILWSFEYDERPLEEELKKKLISMYNEVVKKHEEFYNLSAEMRNVEMKYIFRKTPTYFDIFDKKHVIFKLQNPVKPFQVFSCMSVIDPNLAGELREKFLNIWTFEATN